MLYLLYILILSLSLGQLVRLELLGVTLYAQDFLVPVILLVWLIRQLGVRKSLRISAIGGLILLFAAVAGLSWLNSAQRWDGQQLLIAGMYWARWVLYAGVFFAVRDVVGEGRVLAGVGPKPGKDRISLSEHKIRSRFGTDLLIVDCLVVSGVLLALAGFVQLILTPDFGHMAVSQGWDPHRNRLLSTFFDPNFTGAYLVLTLNLLLGYRVGPLKRVRPYIGMFAPCLAILVVAILLTFSRSAWLMLAVSIGVFGALRSRKLLAVMILVFLAAYLAVPRVQTRIAGGVDPDDSARLRFQSWARTWEIAADYPILGVGFNAYRYAQQEYGFFDWNRLEGGYAGAGADSSLLFVLATTGMVGLSVYLLLAFRMGWTAWVNRASPVGLALLASLTGLLVESNFINSLFYAPIMIWVWVIAGLVVGSSTSRLGRSDLSA